jgi:hypothetical protein
MAQDAKLAKKYKMSPKEYEKSSVDAKHDKQKSMVGLNRGGGMYASGGMYAKGGKGPEGMRERMRGMMGGKGGEGMRERVRPAVMPMRPAVMPVRSGMAKGGMAKGGMAKGKMVKMASGGSFRSSANGIASKGKTKGRMC